MKKYLLSLLILPILSCDLLENNIGNVSLYNEPSDYQLKKMIEHDPRYGDVYNFWDNNMRADFNFNDRVIRVEFEDKVTYKSFLSWLYEQSCVKNDRLSISFEDYIKEYNMVLLRNGKYKYIDADGNRSEFSLSSIQDAVIKSNQNRETSSFKPYLWNGDYKLNNEASKIFEEFSNASGFKNYKYKVFEDFILKYFCETD